MSAKKSLQAVNNLTVAGAAPFRDSQHRISTTSEKPPTSSFHQRKKSANEQHHPLQFHGSTEPHKPTTAFPHKAAAVTVYTNKTYFQTITPPPGKPSGAQGPMQTLLPKNSTSTNKLFQLLPTDESCPPLYPGVSPPPLPLKRDASRGELFSPTAAGSRLAPVQQSHGTSSTSQAQQQKRSKKSKQKFQVLGVKMGGGSRMLDSLKGSMVSSSKQSGDEEEVGQYGSQHSSDDELKEYLVNSGVALEDEEGKQEEQLVEDNASHMFKNSMFVKVQLNHSTSTIQVVNVPDYQLEPMSSILEANQVSQKPAEDQDVSITVELPVSHPPPQHAQNVQTIKLDNLLSGRPHLASPKQQQQSQHIESRIQSFTKSIGRMQDLAKEIQDKVHELHAASQYEQLAQKNEEAGEDEDNEYEVEEDGEKQEYAWRLGMGEKRAQNKEVKAQQETGLRLKDGSIVWPAGAQNLKEQILETQIVDQYTVYGQNILKTVMQQMGPPNTKYGQLLLNQIVTAHKMHSQSSFKRQGPTQNSVSEPIRSKTQVKGAGPQAAQSGLLLQTPLLEGKNLAIQNGIQNSANNGQVQQQKETAQSQGPIGNRIFLSYGDHNKKRFKPVVTTKTEEDRIILAEIQYDIPDALIDQKYLHHQEQLQKQQLQKKPTLQAQTPLPPASLILVEDQYDKMTAHYIKIKDVLKLLIKDDYSEVWVKGSSFKYEDQYEVIEGLDYFKNEFKKMAALELARKKQLMKFNSMKAASIKLQQQQKSSESTNLFRERYRYNYLNWLKQQQNTPLGDPKKAQCQEDHEHTPQCVTQVKQMNNIEIMAVDNFQEHHVGEVMDKGLANTVQIKRDKVCVGANEVHRSKIGSFLQMINNAANGITQSGKPQLSAVGSNIPLKMQFMQGGLDVKSIMMTHQKFFPSGFNRPDSQPILEDGSETLQSYSSIPQMSKAASQTLYPNRLNNNQGNQNQFLDLQIDNRKAGNVGTQSQITTAASSYQGGALIRSNQENDFRLVHLQRDAGKLIQKFEELNKEHDELEKLKKFAESHFNANLISDLSPMMTSGKLMSKQGHAGNQTMYPSQSTYSLAGPSKFGISQGQGVGDDYFSTFQNTAFVGDTSAYNSLSVVPSASQQRLQHKSSMGSISTFGIKTQLSNQNNKAQQQSRFNIILANKKHNLQRKYMELIREKDQVLNEFYSYAQKNVQLPPTQLLNVDIDTVQSVSLPQQEQNIILMQKVNETLTNEGLVTSYKDTRRGIPPSNEASLEIIEMHAKKYHDSPDPGDDYLSPSPQQALKKDMTISSQGMKLHGRQMPYQNYKSAQQNSRFLKQQRGLVLPPAIQNGAKLLLEPPQTRIQVLSRKGGASVGGVSKMGSSGNKQMVIQDEMRKECSTDNRMNRGGKGIVGALTMDIDIMSQNDNLLIDTPTGKSYIQYEVSSKTDFMKQRKTAQNKLFLNNSAIRDGDKKPSINNSGKEQSYDGNLQLTINSALNPGPPIAPKYSLPPYHSQKVSSSSYAKTQSERFKDLPRAGKAAAIISQ